MKPGTSSRSASVFAAAQVAFSFVSFSFQSFFFSSFISPSACSYRGAAALLLPSPPTLVHTKAEKVLQNPFISLHLLQHTLLRPYIGAHVKEHSVSAALGPGWTLSSRGAEEGWSGPPTSRWVWVFTWRGRSTGWLCCRKSTMFASFTLCSDKLTFSECTINVFFHQHEC